LGNYEEGLQFIERAQVQHPERPYLINLIAKFYVFQERYEEAETALESLIAEGESQESKFLGNLILSNFYNYLGKYRAATKAYDYIIDFYWQQNDTSLASYYQMMKGFRLYEGWYDLEPAILEVGKTFPHQNNIDYVLYWTGLSVYYVIKNEFDMAKRIAKSAAVDWWYSSVIALIHIQKAECSEGVVILDTTMHKSTEPIRIFLLYQLATCQFKQKEYDESIQSLIQLQKIRNVSMGFRATYLPKSYYILGKIYEQKGNKDLALKNFTKFLDMWKNADADLPELIDAKARYKRLLENKTPAL
jgi:tetratricopeptide (TPR) repeat protein